MKRCNWFWLVLACLMGGPAAHAEESVIFLDGGETVGADAEPEPAQTLEQLLRSLHAQRDADPAKILLKAQRALALAEQLEDLEASAQAHYYIGQAHVNLGSNAAALIAHQHALAQWQELGQTAGESKALLSLAILSWHSGDYDAALSYALKALHNYETLQDPKGIADTLHNIGIINDYLGNYEMALEHHSRALEMRQKLDDQKGIAESLNNIGIMHYFRHDYPSALDSYQRAQAVYAKIGDIRGSAKSFNNLGVVYKAQGDKQKALEYYLRAAAEAENLGDKYQTANTLNNVGEVYTALEDYAHAAESLNRALVLANELEAKELIRENHEFFSNLYVAQGDYKKALDYYQQATRLKDEIFSQESRQRVVDMQAKYETEKKEQQIALLTKDNKIQQLAIDRQVLQRNSLIGGLLLFFVSIFVLYNRYRFARKLNRQLEDANQLIRLEKEKSDKLLFNILPTRVAIDLKETGKTEPELFEDVTVYFSDIVGFTTVSTGLEPKTLIGELNDIFTAFDNIVEKNQCERVKTIGDAYLCVCGMPTPNPRHAENIVQSATEIIRYMHARNASSSIQWHIRIGIHSGKVVGGVVGVKKYIYDVFGDTINTASRMEANSEPMRINISESTYQLVKDKFSVIPRGLLMVKGKGEMHMYFVDEPLKRESL